MAEIFSAFFEREFDGVASERLVRLRAEVVADDVDHFLCVDRDEYIAVQRYVNTASYLAVRAYNNDIVYNLDDGDTPGAAYSLELPLKFTLDAFNQYN